MGREELNLGEPRQPYHVEKESKYASWSTRLNLFGAGVKSVSDPAPPKAALSVLVLQV